MRLARPLRSLRPLAGWTAVAAMLLLASPGVRVVRAETPSASSDEGLVCKAPAPEERAARRDAVMDQVARRLQAEFAAADDVRPLNGRGYGYRPRPDVLRELQQIELEADLARESAATR